MKEWSETMKKKLQLYIIILIVIAAVVQLGGEKLLDINLLTSFIIEDAVGPEIELEVQDVQIEVGAAITIEEATCDDNYDFFCDVTMSENVNKDVPGSYKVTYTAEDKQGNITIVEYTVNVRATDAPLDASMFIPTGYYDGIDDLTGDALKAALNDIISGHTEFNYSHDTKTDVWDMLRDADEDPENPDNVILFYSGLSYPKDCQQSNTMLDICIPLEGINWVWNREHIWSQSRGDFGTSQGAGTDGHHLVAAVKYMNSLKNNRHFEDCNDGDDIDTVLKDFDNYTCNDNEFEPRDEVKGDVARMIFYMATRYEGENGEIDLEVLDNPNSDKNLKLPQYGDLDDLIRWHLADPVSNQEILRNQVIFGYQENRNPFIDMPSLVELIWGS